MFTGIIRNIGSIKAIDKKEDSLFITIATELSNRLNEGDSVAVNGVCLTVLKNNESAWKARLMAETLQKTNLGQLKENDLVNLELPLRGNQTLDGHFVQGHIDTTCEINDIKLKGSDKIFTFNLPSNISPYLIPKGSIALNGVSLTVVDVSESTFTVSIMPYTLKHTNFGTLNPTDKVNIEVDMIGKYVVSFMQKMK